MEEGGHKINACVCGGGGSDTQRRMGAGDMGGTH